MYFTRHSLLALLSLSIVACGGPLKYQVPSTARAPGADMNVTADVKKAEGKTDLELRIAHLPPAPRVCGGTSFVAWQKGANRPWSRVATLVLDADDRESESKTTVPETSFDFAISCEKEAAPAAPSTDIIFSQRIN